MSETKLDATQVNNVIPKTTMGAGMSDYVYLAPWAYNSITQGTWTFMVLNNALNQNQFYNSTAAQNDQINYKAAFSEGTYTFWMVYYRNPTVRGIVTLLIDGTSVGTIDQAGTSAVNILGYITGISITAGTHTVSLKAATSNTASYYLICQEYGFWRTA